MTAWKPEVVRIVGSEPVPGADALSMVKVAGEHTVVFNKLAFNEGDLVAFVPVDAVHGGQRVKARKFRGVMSYGMFLPCPSGMSEGDSVVEALGLSKYDAVDDEPAHPSDPMPKYTDIQSLRKYHRWFYDGEAVLVTEKIHGENFRATKKGGKLIVGSRNGIKPDVPGCKFWAAARSARLEEVLPEGYVVYGESCGYTNAGGKKFRFDYGTEPGKPRLIIFDVYNLSEQMYLDYGEQSGWLLDHGLSDASVQSTQMEFSFSSVSAFASGKSHFGDHVKEGIVVRPAFERLNDRGDRVILKLHSDEFLLVK